MDGERGRHNGLWRNVHCMASTHQMTRRSSMIRTAIGSCQKLQNRPRDALKLQGNYMVWRVDSVRYCLALSLLSSFFFSLGMRWMYLIDMFSPSLLKTGCFQNFVPITVYNQEQFLEREKVLLYFSENENAKRKQNATILIFYFSLFE